MGKQVRFLDTLKPILQYLPTVRQPGGQVMMKDKIVMTAVTLFIYLICCQVPIYGINKTQGADPFYWVRVILASNRGTLMELGISPIITSGMVIQLLVGIKFLSLDLQLSEDRQLYEQSSKLLALIMTLCESFAYIYSGMYGEVERLSWLTIILIVTQLFFAGLIIIMLDEMLQVGYGLGSGISLFIAVNVCEGIVWQSFSPITIKSEQGTEFEGSVVAAVHLLLTRPNKMGALYHAFYRQNAPNLNNLLATFLVFLLVIYFQGFAIQLPLSSQKVKGYTAKYPIKLFYTSTTPIILQSAMVSNLYMFSQILYKRFKGNFFVRLLGQWQDVEHSQHAVPVAGFAYYISPPKNFNAILQDPLHFLFYLFFIMFCCAMFSKLWIEISGEGPKDIAKKLKNEDMTLTGFRDKSLIKVLNNYIPTAAACGGIMIGLLTVIADFMGAIGSGTGILLAVNIIYGYFEKYYKEKKQQTEFLGFSGE